MITNFLSIYLVNKQQCPISIEPSLLYEEVKRILKREEERVREGGGRERETETETDRQTDRAETDSVNEAGKT